MTGSLAVNQWLAILLWLTLFYLQPCGFLSSVQFKIDRANELSLCTDCHELQSYIPSPLNLLEETRNDIKWHGFHCNLYQNQHLSFQPSTISFTHSSAAATGGVAAGYFSRVSPQQHSQARLWSPRTWKEPSSEFWIHPRAFLSIGYTLNTSKRMHSGGTLFKSRIHFSRVTPFPAVHFRCQDPSLTSL